MSTHREPVPAGSARKSPDLTALLHLVDRAEHGRLLADEATLLRDGLRSLDAARRSAGGLQAALRQARAELDAARAAEHERRAAS